MRKLTSVYAHLLKPANRRLARHLPSAMGRAGIVAVEHRVVFICAAPVNLAIGPASQRIRIPDNVEMRPPAAARRYRLSGQSIFA